MRECLTEKVYNLIQLVTENIIEVATDNVFSLSRQIKIDSKKPSSLWSQIVQNTSNQESKWWI